MSDTVQRLIDPNGWDSAHFLQKWEALASAFNVAHVT